MKDYYRILQVDPAASLEVINSAYRALVKQFHPDLYHTSRKAPMGERMREINEAYQVLSNTHTRAQYDQKYQASPSLSNANQTSRPWQWQKHPAVQILAWSLGTYLVLNIIPRLIFRLPFLRIGVLILVIYWIGRSWLKTARSSSRSSD